MPEYRRANIPGAMYFFTVVTFQRRPFLTTDAARSCLRESIRWVQEKHPFAVEGIVILPDHLHILWGLPEGDTDFPLRWRSIKSAFTKRYLTQAAEPAAPSISRWRKQERGVWQRRYWEHLIRDEHDMRQHLDYIHFNPVKHGYTQRPGDWPWSSFQQYVKMGWYDLTWGDLLPADVPAECVGEPQEQSGGSGTHPTARLKA
jgi:putative transposase